MNGFTCRETRETLSYQTLSVRLDSKGRISIPAFLRRNYSLEKSSVLLGFNLEKNVLFLSLPTACKESRINQGKSCLGNSMTSCNANRLYRKVRSLGSYGQGGVTGSTKACGAFSPGPRGLSLQKAFAFPKKALGKKCEEGPEIPGPDPQSKTLKSIKGK